MALALITTGRADAGLKFIETALRLNPSPPTYYVLARGMALFALYDLERAASVLSEALDPQSGRDRIGAPSTGHLCAPWS